MVEISHFQSDRGTASSVNIFFYDWVSPLSSALDYLYPDTRKFYKQLPHYLLNYRSPNQHRALSKSHEDDRSEIPAYY
jgi:hypothetical protein